MRAGVSGHYAPVFYIHLSGQGRIADQDAVPAHITVVGDVDVRHHQGVVPDTGDSLAAGFGSPVDGGAFSDIHPVADLYPGLFSLEFQVLGNAAHDGAREDGTVPADLHMVQDGGVVQDSASVANFSVCIDEGKGPHLYIVP